MSDKRIDPDDEFVPVDRYADFLDSIRDHREDQLIKERALKNEEVAVAMDYIEVFLESEAGRRVLWDILERSEIMGRVYEANANTNFNLGKRDVGLFLLRRLGLNNPAGIFRLHELSREVDKSLRAMSAKAEKEAKS